MTATNRAWQDNPDPDESPDGPEPTEAEEHAALDAESRHMELCYLRDEVARLNELIGGVLSAWEALPDEHPAVDTLFLDPVFNALHTAIEMMGEGYDPDGSKRADRGVAAKEAEAEWGQG